MTLRQFTLTFTISFTLIACNNSGNRSVESVPINQQAIKNISTIPDPEKTTKNSTITKIAFATGGCEGTCAMTAYQIDSSLNILYFGGLHSKKSGFYIGQIDKVLWNAIIQKADSFAPKQLNENYYKSEDDLSMQIVFCYEDSKKNIAGTSHGLPTDFKNFFHWLEETIGQIKLTQTNRILTFETTIQYTPGDRIKYLKKKNG